MKLQDCTKCGAQFDVSSFAPGQKFSCGSCGAVLTAHVGAAPGGRTPGGAAPGGRAPGAKVPGGRAPNAAPKSPARGRTSGKAPAAKAGPRGAQYTPPERSAGKKKSTARGSQRPAQRSTQGGRQGRGRAPARDTKKGINPAILFGAGGLVIAAVLAFLLIGSGSGDDKGGAGNGGTSITGTTGTTGTTAVQPDPVKKPDTVASIQQEFDDAEPTEGAQYRQFAKRFLALGEAGRESAKGLYETLIKEVDPNDVVARKFLGWTDFQTDLLGRELDDATEPFPEIIANRRGYPYLSLIQEFSMIRWLKDEDQIEDAKKAVTLMNEHAERLRTDHTFRAGDQIRANIAMNPLLRDLNYETYWAEPYLVVYSSSDTLSELDLRKIKDKDERKEKREKLREKRKDWENVLKEKAAIMQSIYKEWMRRYGERFKLKPLHDPWGGRPDYKPGKRSYEDGAPMVIWIFTDHEAFQKYHEKYMGGRLPPGVAGYFTPRTGWIFLFDEKGEQPNQRAWEINKTVHEATHQLEFWFTKQRNKWGDPKNSQNAFSEGVAEFLGSTQMQKDRTLKFIEVNVPRINMMKQTMQGLENAGFEYELFPIKDLMGFTSYQQATQWARANWGHGNGMGMLYEQGWAFTYFLNHYKNGKYKENWLDYFDMVLDRQTGGPQNRLAFMRAFNIRDEDEWDEIQEEWETYFKDVILEMAKDLSKWTYKPPKRKDPWK